MTQQEEPKIVYAIQGELQNHEAKSLWISSGFLQYNPDFNWDEFPNLLKHSDIVVTARHDGRLIGMTRAVTDVSVYCGLIDIMVDNDYKQQGIGRELAWRTREAAGEKAWLVAMSNDAVAGFYKQSGFVRVDDGWSAWILTPPENT